MSDTVSDKNTVGLDEQNQMIKDSKKAIEKLSENKAMQLSNKAITERIRALVPQAIVRMEQLMHSDNDNVALGATKVILNKTAPDLKAVEVSGKTDLQGLVIVRNDTGEIIASSEEDKD